MLKFSRCSELRARRAGIIAVAIVCGLVIAGCSALRLTYSQGPQIAYLWLDRQFDFDDPQAARAKEGLARWFDWHRRQELPQIAALLSRASDEVTRDMTGEQLCRYWDALAAHADAAVEQALPDAYEVARLLGARQLATLRKRQARSDEKFADDYLQPDPAKRRRAAIERTVERAQRLYGRLGDAQHKAIEQAVDASPFDPQRTLVERQRRHAELQQLLEHLQAQPALTRGDAASALRRYWQHVRHSPDESYAGYASHLTAYSCEASARVHNATTAAQRATARERLRDWAADLRQLATTAS
ncbi:DUF6279 family lipoprotein [Caldimonas sp. KR1-144]|uniref:DUF6279 family lipoprotein n=1 Tax=Caldimonas sp. KR1-144 TaxID=3400911 RepID=UPI003C028480